MCHSFTRPHVRRVISLGCKRTILDPSFNKEEENDGGDWQFVLHIAEDAARRAGEIMRQTTGRISVKNEKANLRDIVTDSDIACQQVIRQTIDAVFPSALFLGEEDVGSGSQASIHALQEALAAASNSNQEEQLLWIVDPIDGTTNFQAGLPLFCASIGVVSLSQYNEPEIMVGVIYNPILDEMTCAVKGRGAYLNGKRIKIEQTCPKLEESLVNVGFPAVKESTLEASSRAVATLATKVRGLRMIACASQVLAWVARDQFQVYISWDLNAWDICAGMLIVRESGGAIMDFKGSPASIASRDMIFTSQTGGLGENLRQILDQHDCLEYD
jgi:myo-inositol-1(or 4)-monophosphatase